MADDLIIKSAEFAGAFAYQHPPQRLDFDRRGRVLICGNEGSGKSTLPEILSLNAFGRGSYRVKQNYLREGQIVNNRSKSGYFSSVHYRIGKQDLNILQAYKHVKHGSKYTITVDGKPITPDGKPAQRALIQKLIPMSFDEWMGVAYLSQGSIHSLLSSSSTEKRSYLSSIFGLDVYEHFIDEAKAELKALQLSSGASQAAAIESDRAEARARLKAAVKDFQRALPDGQSLAELRDIVRELRDKADRYAKQIGAAESARVLEQRERKLRKKLDVCADNLSKLGVNSESISDQSLADAREAVQRAFEKSVKLKNAAKQYEEAQRELSSLNSMRKKLKNEVGEIELSLSKSKSRSRNRSQPIDKLLSRLPDDDMLSSSEFSLRVKDGTSDDWRTPFSEYMSLRASEQKLLSLAAKGHNKCPTCERDLHKKELEKAAASVSESRVQAAQRTSGAVLALAREQLGSSNSILERAATPYTLRLLLQKERKKISEDEKRVEDLERRYDRAKQRLQDLNERISSYKMPADADESAVTAAKNKHERALALEAAISEFSGTKQKLSAVVKDLKKLRLSSEAGSSDDLESALASVQRKAAKAEERVTLASVAERAVADARKEIARQDEKLAAVAADVERMKALQDLVIPYLTTVRVAKVNECVEVLQSVLPVWVGAMFGSPNVSGAEIKIETDEAKRSMEIMLKSKNHKSFVSPLQASGGERKRFTLALIGALREIAPRRSNVLFFDEPFADLKADGKTRFVEQQLPMMLERCRGLTSIFVIAHDREVLHGSASTFDRVWRVSENGKRGSTVEELSKLSSRDF